MKKMMVLLILLGCLLAASPVFADGVFYWTESIPPTIPYQRAILWFDGSRETLLVQSKYQTTGQTGGRLGWVIPVPAVPELASMDAGQAEHWFYVADTSSTPRVTRVSDWLQAGFLVGTHVGAVLMLGACGLSLFTRSPQFLCRHRPALALSALLILLPLLTYILVARLDFWHMPVFLLCPAVAAAILARGLIRIRSHRPWHSRADSRLVSVSALFSLGIFVLAYLPLTLATPGMPDSTVEIVKAEQVGIYDVQVVTAGQGTDLIDWLKQNEFRFDEIDEQVFDDYVQRGWCFVVAQVDPSRSDQAGATPEALVAPLIVRFQTTAPVYPLALTATAGHETEILLYLFSEQKWTANERLELHYAGGSGDLGPYVARAVGDPSVEPTDFFTGKESALSYLCKFKGTMSAADMEQDLVFAPAGDQEPYRKRLVVW